LEGFRINGQTLINTGQTNDAGAVWGALLVQGQSGVPVDVTPTLVSSISSTGIDYTFQEKAAEIYPPAVDANRDGSITFDSQDQTTQSNPYRFWVNNDRDGYDSTIDDYDDVEPVDGTTDNLNTSITCARDLEDYARLWINTQGLTEDLKNGHLLLALEWKNVSGYPGIRIFQAVETAGGTLYLTDETTAQAQIAAPYGNCLNGGGVDELQGSVPFFIPTSAWANVSDAQPVGHFLFDAVGHGSGQLEIAIYKNDGATKLAEGPPLYLDLQDVKEMYERWTVDNNGAVATAASQITTPYAYDSMIPAENNYILFVHGWNLAPWERDAFAETAFKRLYWQGYKGHFGAFQWPTLTGGTTFDQSELLAWRSAEGLRKKLDDLNSQYPGHVYVFAHSMGNVVAGEALKLEGTNQPVNTYIAMQGAIASHAYDSNTPIRSLGVYDDYTPNRYAQYPTNGGVCYFSDIEGAGVYVNFYNPMDYALVSGTFSWELDQDFKPDTYRGYTYDSIDRKFYHDGAELILPFDRYEIFSGCDEARCHALGAQADVGGGFTGAQIDLRTIWPPDNSTDDPTKKYSDHKWHSAEFNFDNMQQGIFWETLLGIQGFNLK
jgi:hypothetical protein